jgi:hypothetical protein
VEGGNSKEPPKTNAAQASHPGRIVIADNLTAVFRFRKRSSGNPHSEECFASMLSEASASEPESSV